MKKQLLLGLIFTLVGGIVCGQHLIRVNNNAGADPDYATIQAANDAAINGDTIYIEGSTTAYAGADISKRLIIIGPGYFLTENDSTQANGLEVQINGAISFNPGSSGSIIAGCVVSGIGIGADNLSITRCNFSSISIIVNTVNNILIVQNYCSSIYMPSNKMTNSIIANNMADHIFCNASCGPLQIINNIITGYSYGGISAYNSSIANNILTQTTANMPVHTGNTINNNIFAGAGTNANGNLYNVVMANVFVDFSGSLKYSDDAKWKLKTGSPAIGAGVSGVDCGVFGGAAPYVLSGIPNLPHIYEASIPGTAYSDKGLACTIKVKSGK
ncbi:MAG: hypothetical protein MUC78_13475 [Bacteroidales bacterium]|jgi:hypothetical protein|nr:hypothetical protein [Bacteroidales bacterium]